jgi:hypothetical protein
MAAGSDDEAAPRSPRQRQMIDGAMMELHDALDKAFSELSETGSVGQDTCLRVQNDLATLITLLRPYRNEPKHDGDAWEQATAWEQPEQMLQEIAQGQVVEQQPSGRRNAQPEQQRTGKVFDFATLLESAQGMIDFAHTLGFTPKAKVQTPVADPDPV